jgi:transposase
MGKVRRDFTREFKIEAARLSYQTGKTQDEFAEDMGISRSSLSRWRRELRDDPQQAFPGKGQPKERDAEIAQLKKQLKQAEMEREVLKKAQRCRHRRHPSRKSRDEIPLHTRTPVRLAHQPDVSSAEGFTQWLLQLAQTTSQCVQDG